MGRLVEKRTASVALAKHALDEAQEAYKRSLRDLSEAFEEEAKPTCEAIPDHSAGCSRPGEAVICRDMGGTPQDGYTETIVCGLHVWHELKRQQAKFGGKGVSIAARTIENY